MTFNYIVIYESFKNKVVYVIISILRKNDMFTRAVVPNEPRTPAKTEDPFFVYAYGNLGYSPLVTLKLK